MATIMVSLHAGTKVIACWCGRGCAVVLCDAFGDGGTFWAEEVYFYVPWDGGGFGQKRRTLGPLRSYTLTPYILTSLHPYTLHSVSSLFTDLPRNGLLSLIRFWLILLLFLCWERGLRIGL